MHGCVQIGYCGLDKQSLGAGPDAGSLDVEDYCRGYVSWDFLMIFLQVSPLACPLACLLPASLRPYWCLAVLNTHSIRKGPQIRA
jgi:hypothetical protein